MLKLFTEVSGSVTANDNNPIGIDFSFFTTDSATIKEDDSEQKKKKSTKPKVAVNGQVVSDRMVNPVPGANVAETDYARSYNETSNLIRGTIVQADELAYEIKEDIDAVRSSKTLKNKYTYLTNLTTTASSLLSTKISAIKELNSTITQTHNLELNRLKLMKANEKEENDDMRMMDIYSAFVNAPVGVYNPMGNPNIQELTLGVNNPASSVSAIEMVAPGSHQGAQQLSAEQNRMRMESNPNIQTVVLYDQASGQRMFDVIDKSTGNSVPNYPRPDPFLLEDTTIDVHARIARNRNINTVWPLVIKGSNNFINEY